MKLSKAHFDMPTTISVGQSKEKETVYLDFPFELRPYQRAVIDKLFKEKKSLLYLLWCARAGKDLTCFFAIVLSALNSPGRVFGYFLPTKEIARRVIFDGRLDDGRRMLDLIPKVEVLKIDNVKMLITLRNGAKIQFLSTDKNKGDSAAGETWKGVVVSEFALMQYGSTLLQILRPRIARDGGFLIVNTTPRGAIGAGYELWQESVPNPAWYNSKTTIADIYTQEFIDAYIKKVGLDNFEARRELYCDFFAPIAGSIYATIIEGFKFTEVFVSNNDTVFVAMDLGFKRDATAWWVFTCINGVFCFIDFSIVFGGNFGDILDGILDQYSNPYFIVPHDADKGGSCSAVDRILERNLDFYVVPKTNSVEGDIKGIVKPFLKERECRFKPCKNVSLGLSYLKMYRRSTHSGSIYHGTDGASDAADAFRYAICGIYHGQIS